MNDTTFAPPTIARIPHAVDFRAELPMVEADWPNYMPKGFSRAILAHTKSPNVAPFLKACFENIGHDLHGMTRADVAAATGFNVNAIGRILSNPVGRLFFDEFCAELPTNTTLHNSKGNSAQNTTPCRSEAGRPDQLISLRCPADVARDLIEKVIEPRIIEAVDPAGREKAYAAHLMTAGYDSVALATEHAAEINARLKSADSELTRKVRCDLESEIASRLREWQRTLQDMSPVDLADDIDPKTNYRAAVVGALPMIASGKPLSGQQASALTGISERSLPSTYRRANVYNKPQFDYSPVDTAEDLPEPGYSLKRKAAPKRLISQGESQGHIPYTIRRSGREVVNPAATKFLSTHQARGGEVVLEWQKASIPCPMTDDQKLEAAAKLAQQRGKAKQRREERKTGLQARPEPMDQDQAEHWWIGPEHFSLWAQDKCTALNDRVVLPDGEMIPLEKLSPRQLVLVLRGKSAEVVQMFVTLSQPEPGDRILPEPIMPIATESVTADFDPLIDGLLAAGAVLVSEEPTEHPGAALHRQQMAMPEGNPRDDFWQNLPDEDRWDLIDYRRELRKAKVAA